MATGEKASVRASLGSELVAAFEAIDTDKSGTIDRAELGAAMRAVLPETTDAEVANMIKLAGGSEELSLQEFLMLMLVTQPAAAAEGVPA